MKRNTASALAMGVAITAVAAAAAIASGPAYADDITVESRPFVSSLSRDAVLADFKKPGPNAWSSSYNMFSRKSNKTRDEVKSEYMASRDQSAALNSEDSGSAYFMRTGPEGADARAMGASPR